jgi:hypothetical protein
MANLPILYSVESSNVTEIGYQEEDRTFYVRFHNGALYAYYEVEPDVFDLMMSANSKGSFVWQYLRDRYNYSRVE